MHGSSMHGSSMHGEQSQELRVLLVEDNRVMADVMRFNFNRAGFAATVALNGRIAWDLLQIETFELLVTDFQMPEMDGGELCRRIRAEPRFADLPIILLTGKGMEIDRERLTRELGVSLIIFKPFSPRQLVAAAEDCAGRCHGADCPAAERP